MNEKGAMGIARGLKKNQGLKKLKLSMNSVGNNGVKEIALALVDNPFNTVEEIDFSRSWLELNEDNQALFELIRASQTLRVLNLRDNLVREIPA